MLILFVRPTAATVDFEYHKKPFALISQAISSKSH
jgi:hypothetical protein